MAHYARVNYDKGEALKIDLEHLQDSDDSIVGLVEQVIVADSDFINSFVDTSPGEWIQTSYNTHAGVNNREGGTALRKNYAGIGFVYDKTRDAFYSQRPYPSWSLNLETCRWEPPVPYPDDYDTVGYLWNEANKRFDSLASLGY